MKKQKIVGKKSKGISTKGFVYLLKKYNHNPRGKQEEGSVSDKTRKNVLFSPSSPADTTTSDEKKDNKNNKKIIGVIKRETLLQIRGLLKDFPRDVELDGNLFDPVLIARDFVSIYDLLIYCRSKTKKDEVRGEIENQINIMKEIPVEELRRLIFELRTSTVYGASGIVENIKAILLRQSTFINNQISIFILAVPSKKRSTMNIKTLHGFSGAEAEEYESSEISEGEKIKPGQSFKLDEEGSVIPLEED